MFNVPNVVNIPLFTMLPPTNSVLPDIILYSPAVTDKLPIITPFVVEAETNAGTKNDNVCAPDVVAVVA